MNAAAETAFAPPASALPDMRTLTRLFAGGVIGLVAWEIWGRGLAPVVLGEALEPAQLIIGLVQNWTGVEMPGALALIGHILVGIIAYPLMYWIVSRHLKNWGVLFDGAVWALFTAAAGWMFLSGKGYAGLAVFWLAVTALYASRAINPSPVLANAVSWGSFTWFNALGIMAPLAGMSFLVLEDSALFSAMSWGGHLVYGAIAALAFEWWSRRA